MSGMDGSPRILTVSFGAFSCTLEGFDDPVAALAAITEHLRALSERSPGWAREVATDWAAGGTTAAVAPAGIVAEVAAEESVAVGEAVEEPEQGPDEPALTVDSETSVEVQEVSDIREVVGAEVDTEPEAPALRPALDLPDTLADDGVRDMMEAAQAVAGVGSAARSETVEEADPDLGRLSAFLASGGIAPAPPRAKADVQSAAVARAMAAAEAAHDWGVGEDWPEERLPAEGKGWLEGRFTARVLGRNAEPVGVASSGGASSWAAFARQGSDEAGTTSVAVTAPMAAPVVPAEPPHLHEDLHPEARRLLDTSPDEDEAAMLRFLDQADRQLSDPEIARRREAMSHLKAAVAATEAQRVLGEPGHGPGTFREEWAAALRPAGGKAAAPLRLVASQRVDGSKARPAKAAEAAAVPAPAAGPLPFAAFAAQAGAAANLPDLLEAAAAWAAVVLREEVVSRGQLVRLASEAMDEPPSREDALRVFGILLRQGRLERVDNGRFRVGARTRFAPERHAG